MGSLAAVSGLTGVASSASALIQVATRSPAEIHASTVLAMSKGPAQSLAELQQSLASVDVDLLVLAQNEGLRFQVVQPGDSLLELGLIRVQTTQALQQDLPRWRDFSDRTAAEVDQKFGAELQRLASQLKPHRVGFSLGAPDPIAEAYTRLQKERRDSMIDRIIAEEVPVKLYSVPIPDGVDFNMANVLANQSLQPTTLAEMARVHGATSPEEVQEFQALVAGINGERWQQALAQGRQSMLEAKIRQAKGSGQSLSAEQQSEFSSRLEANPERVVVDHARFGLLVPDIWYQHFQGQSFKVDGHDRGSLENWTGQTNEKGIRVATGLVNDEPFGVRGQFFYPDGVNKVAVRSEAVAGQTPVHELGHALESLLKKRDPAFFKDWHLRVEKAYQASIQRSFTPGSEGGEPISTYAQTNVGEYVAEGFSHYHGAASDFQSKDPVFYQLMQEFIQHLKELRSSESAPPTLAEALRRLR